MQGHLLKPQERKFIEEARKNTSDKKAYMKLSVLVLLDEGFSQEVVSTALGISLGTVSNCKQKYECDGLSKYLDKHYAPYQGKLDAKQLVLLEQEVEKGLYTTCFEVTEWVKREFNISYKESGIRGVLSKLGFVYKKTTAVPGGLEVKEQDTYLKQLEPFLTETPAADEVVLFMDAVHPQHNTRSDYAWIKRGTKKEIRSNTGRNRMNINGAMNALQPEEVTVVESECINAQSTQELFEKLLRKYPGKKTIYIIADNAKYYSNATLREWIEKNPKIKLLHLPPYSPNLNLIERLWKFMRKKVINLHYYPQFDEFKQAIRDFFENIQQYKDELRSLITPNFQRFSQTA